MPFKTRYRPARERERERLAGEATQKVFVDDSLLVFPSHVIEKDTTDMVADEWDGWLKWDGTIESLPSFESRRQSTASSFYESEASAVDMIKNPESIFYDGGPDDDAPFELDEPITSPPFPFQQLSFTYNDDSTSLKLTEQSMENPGRPLHAYSTLSALEERELRDIAMPDYGLAQAADTEEHDSPVPMAIKCRGRPRGLKRKSPPATEAPLDIYQHRKQSHNTIEKRYRINLNDKIDILRRSIPKFHDIPSKVLDGDEEPVSPSTYKSGKAAVLTGAVEYISQLEQSTRSLAAETATLKSRLAAFEKLAMAGSIFSGANACPPGAPGSELLEEFDPATALKARLANTDLSAGGPTKHMLES